MKKGEQVEGKWEFVSFGTESEESGESESLAPFISK